MTRTELLNRAASIVTGERQQAYGGVEDNFGRIAAYWSAHLGTEVTAHDVAIMMILMKAARLHNTPGHEDSLVDIAGYAACAVELPAPGKVTRHCIHCRHMLDVQDSSFYCGHYERTYSMSAADWGCAHWEAK